MKMTNRRKGTGEQERKYLMLHTNHKLKSKLIRNRTVGIEIYFLQTVFFILLLSLSGCKLSHGTIIFSE